MSIITILDNNSTDSHSDVRDRWIEWCTSLAPVKPQVKLIWRIDVSRLCVNRNKILWLYKNILTCEWWLVKKMKVAILSCSSYQRSLAAWLYFWLGGGLTHRCRILRRRPCLDGGKSSKTRLPSGPCHQ